MNNTSRDERIARAFELALQGKSPEGEEDLSVGELVKKLLQLQKEHKVRKNLDLSSTIARRIVLTDYD